MIQNRIQSEHSGNCVAVVCSTHPIKRITRSQKCTNVKLNKRDSDHESHLYGRYNERSDIKTYFLAFVLAMCVI